MMLTILFVTSACLPVIFMLTLAPVGRALVILTQTALIGVALHLALNKSWPSFILMMIFMSGLMVVFAYLCSLTANSLISHPTLPSLFPVSTSIFFMTVIIYNSNLNLYYEMFINLNSIDTLSKSTYKLYSENNLSLTLVLIIYLLIALIAVVKISSMNPTPLRSNT